MDQSHTLAVCLEASDAGRGIVVQDRSACRPYEEQLATVDGRIHDGPEIFPVEVLQQKGEGRQVEPPAIAVRTTLEIRCRPFGDMDVETRCPNGRDQLSSLGEPAGQPVQESEEAVGAGLRSRRGRRAVHHPHLRRGGLARASGSQGHFASEGVACEHDLGRPEVEDQRVHIGGAGRHGMGRSEPLAVSVQSEIGQHDPPVRPTGDQASSDGRPVPPCPEEPVQEQNPAPRSRTGGSEPPVRENGRPADGRPALR